MEAKNRTRPTHEQVTKAMYGLEYQINDLTHMMHIAADLVDRALAAADCTDGNRRIYKIDFRDVDALMFSINEVELRVGNLKDSYFAAREGEQVQ